MTYTPSLIERILESATGNPYGDGEMIRNVGQGYAEPGYPSDAKWVTGNWNNRTKYVPGIVGGRATSHAQITTDKTPERLAKALEWLGYELEWSDEWIECGECYKLVRTEADSYSWTPSYLWANDCEIICHECAKLDPAAYLEDYVNDADKAVTWLTSAELSKLGWVQTPEDEYFENGWHPGQTDNPHAILEAIQDETPGAEVVFLINSVGQFDCRFTAWVKDEVND